MYWCAIVSSDGNSPQTKRWFLTGGYKDNVKETGNLSETGESICRNIIREGMGFFMMRIIGNKKFVYGIVILMTFIIFLFLFSHNTMNQYDVYKLDTNIIVENRKDPDTFFYKERIYYYTSIKDAYLCTKNGTEARNEEEAYLYVDLGEAGDWWADPFGNLEKEAEVENEDIPDGLMNVIEKNNIDIMQDIWPMTENVEMTELTEEEVKAAMPESYEEICLRRPEIQRYYEVDFDNDGKKDIMLDVRWGSGWLAFKETYFYKQIDTGQYKKTFHLNTSSCSGNLLIYGGKVYYMEVYWNYFPDPEKEYAYGYCELYYFEDGRPQEAIRFTPKSKNIEESHRSGGESVFDIRIRRRFVNDFINISEGFS